MVTILDQRRLRGVTVGIFTHDGHEVLDRPDHPARWMSAHRSPLDQYLLSVVTTTESEIVRVGDTDTARLHDPGRDRAIG